MSIEEDREPPADEPAPAAAATAGDDTARRTAQVLAAARPLAIGLVAGLVIAAGVWWLASGDESKPASRSKASTPPTAACTWHPLNGVAGRLDVGTPPATATAAGTAKWTITTNLGVIEVTIDAAKTPCAAANFTYLAAKHALDGSRCHRLGAEFSPSLLECGRPTGDKTGVGYAFTGESFARQAPLSATPGPPVPCPSLPGNLVSPGGNTEIIQGSTCKLVPFNDSGPMQAASAGTVLLSGYGPGGFGSEFAFVHHDDLVPAAYSPFGTVTRGMDIVEKVAAAGTAPVKAEGNLEIFPVDGPPAQELVIQATTVTVS